MRLLWYSNAPWAPSGYGKQTALWVPRLKSLGHDVAIAAFYGLMGTGLNWQGVTVYPGSPEDQWALDLLPGHYARHKADYLITLMDAWVLDPNRFGDMKVLHWEPVDCSPLGRLDRQVLTQGGGRVIAMSEHGRREFEAAGFTPFYVPHGLDTKMFAPLPEDERFETRRRTSLHDTFLIGINAANQDPVRKGYGEQLDAFAQFHKRHPRSKLLIHTRAATRTGVDLRGMLDNLGLGEDTVAVGDQYLIASGMTQDNELARWYACIDLFSNCSHGEGFGIPIIEAQACGTPVVVTNASSMPELAGPGWVVKGQRHWNAGHNAWWVCPDTRAILAAYEKAYQLWRNGRMPALRAKTREFALTYDADLILDAYWKPLLRELEAQL